LKYIETRVLEYTFGVMVDDTRVSGKMENNMVYECSIITRKEERDIGRRVKEYAGMIEFEIIIIYYKMNKKYHLFDDGNYIEFSINNNYKTFAF
jgi:hypothetical protein